MISKKEDENKLFYNFRIDDYVPEDHLLRLIDKHIKFDFIYEKVKHLYSHTGQPAIDPVVLIKMLLIGYLYDIKSERQIEKEVQVNLAYRWFIKYDIDEKVPDHSTISQTRRRKFSDSSLFQDLFDHVVKLCIEAGLVRGDTILTDATHIKANASLDSLKEIVTTPKEYLSQLDQSVEQEDNQNKNDNNRYSNDTHKSSTDPDSRLSGRSPKMPPGLYYLEQRSMDISGYITDVHIFPGNYHEYTPYVERLRRQREVYKLPIHNAVADRGYGIGKIYKDLTDMDIQAYIPFKRREKPHKDIFTKNDFIYDHKRDEYICPAGHRLHRTTQHPRKKDNSYTYRGTQSVCNSTCPLRNKCVRTDSNYPKEIQRSVYQEYIDRQLSKKDEPLWKYLLRKRKTLIEGSFGDAKCNHGFDKAKYRRRVKVQEQSIMTAVAQNIKKLVKDLERFEEEAVNRLRILINILLSRLAIIIVS